MATRKNQKTGSKPQPVTAPKAPVTVAPEPQKESESMATRKQGTAPAQTETSPEVELGKLQWLDWNLIDFESFPNCRKGNWDKPTAKKDSENGTTGNKDEGTTFEQLEASIEETGQKDPITIRLKAGKNQKKPYECIKGFRRGKAVRNIWLRAQEAWEKKGGSGEHGPCQIKVIVKELSDLAAREENVFENTARDNLSSADLAQAANDLLEEYESAGVKMSINRLAKRMGKNQSYLNGLVSVVAKTPKLFEAWRTETVVIPVDKMVEIAKIDDKTAESMGFSTIEEAQTAAYENVKAGKALDGQTNGKGRRTPTDAETKVANLADRMGNLFGRLEELGYIKMTAKWSVELLRVLGADFEKVSDVAQQKAITAAVEAHEKAGAAIRKRQEQAGAGKRGEGEETSEPTENAVN